MKAATFPSLCVEADLLEAVEQSLREGETISSFVEQAIRDSVERRRHQREFIARRLVSRDEAKRTGVYIKSDVVIGRVGGAAEARFCAYADAGQRGHKSAAHPTNYGSPT